MPAVAVGVVEDHDAVAPLRLPVRVRLALGDPEPAAVVDRHPDRLANGRLGGEDGDGEAFGQAERRGRFLRACGEGSAAEMVVADATAHCSHVIFDRRAGPPGSIWHGCCCTAGHACGRTGDQALRVSVDGNADAEARRSEERFPRAADCEHLDQSFPRPCGPVAKAGIGTAAHRRDVIHRAFLRVRLALGVSRVAFVVLASARRAARRRRVVWTIRPKSAKYRSRSTHT